MGSEMCIRDSIRPSAKSATGQNADFCLIGEYPFHGTLLGGSPWADIRKSLHSMGLRTSL